MNVALTCVEYKLIPAAFKECYFSKPYPQSKPNTLNHYSQCCVYLFAVHSFLNSFRDSFWSWSLRCSVENALPRERQRETIPDVTLQIGLLYTTKKAEPIPWPWRNRVQRQSKLSIKVFWRVDWFNMTEVWPLAGIRVRVSASRFLDCWPRNPDEISKFRQLHFKRQWLWTVSVAAYSLKVHQL